MWRYSPWIGTKYCGRTSAWTIFSSSCEAWPRTWTSRAVVEDAGAEPEEIVDSAVDQRLVSGWRGGEDDSVARLDLHVLVVAVSHTSQRRGRLALAAGRDDDDLFRRQLSQVIHPHAHLAREVEVTAFARHLDVVHHAAPGDEYPAAVEAGRVDHLLHARDQ
jgi:hypothetical protein